MIDPTIKCNDMIRVPTTVAESGCIQIVYDSRHCPGNSMQPGVGKYNLLAQEVNPETGRFLGVVFEVTEEEIRLWRAES